MKNDGNKTELETKESKGNEGNETKIDKYTINENETKIET